MTDDEVIAIADQGARYLQAATQDQDLNMRLTHYNYAYAYLETALRFAEPSRISALTGIDAVRAMEMTTRGQNDVSLEYMRRMGIPIRVPLAGARR